MSNYYDNHSIYKPATILPGIYVCLLAHIVHQERQNESTNFHFPNRGKYGVYFEVNYIYKLINFTPCDEYVEFIAINF